MIGMVSRSKPGTAGQAARIALAAVKFALKGVGYVFAGFGFVLIGVYAMNHLTNWKLIYNRTASMPMGIYVIHERQIPTHAGQIVVVKYDAPEWAYKEGITGKTEKFIKKIGAMPGDHVVEDGRSIYRCPTASTPVSQCVVLGERVKQEFDGYTFPSMFFAPTVPKGKIYLTSDSPLGFDSRYLGYFNMSLVIGVAHPILTFGPNYPTKIG